MDGAAEDELSKIYEQMAAIHGMTMSEVSDAAWDEVVAINKAASDEVTIAEAAVTEKEVSDAAWDKVIAINKAASDEATIEEAVTEKDVSDAAWDEIVAINDAASDEATIDEAVFPDALALALDEVLHETATPDQIVAVGANETVTTEAAIDDIGFVKVDNAGDEHENDQVADAFENLAAAKLPISHVFKITMQTPLQTVFLSSQLLEKLGPDWIFISSNLIIDTIFRSMLNTPLTLLSHDFRREAEILPNDLIYEGEINHPIWMRPKHWNVLNSSVEDFIMRHARLTARIQNGDDVTHLPLYFKLHYDTSPRVLKIYFMAKEGADVKGIREFRIFLKSYILRWMKALLKKSLGKGKSKNARRAEAKAKRVRAAEAQAVLTAKDSKAGPSMISHASQSRASKTNQVSQTEPSKVAQTAQAGSPQADAVNPGVSNFEGSQASRAARAPRAVHEAEMVTSGQRYCKSPRPKPIKRKRK